MPDNNFRWKEALKYIFKGHGKNVFLMILYFLVATIPFWSTPILTARLIDLASMEPGQRMQLFFIYMGIMVFLVLLNYPMAMLFVNRVSLISRGVGRSLRTKICRQLQQLTLLYHDKQDIGPMQSKAIRDIELIEHMPRMVCHNLVSPVIILVAALVSIVLRAPAALVFFIFLLAVSVGLRQVFSKRFRKIFHDYRTSLESMTTGLSDMLTMIPVTRAHGLEKYELKSVGKKIRKVAEKGRTADIVGGRFSAGAWVTFTLTHTAFVGTAVYLCFRGVFTVGDVVMFSAFFARLSGSISGVLHTLPEISKIKESIISIREVLNAPDKEVNRGKAAVESVTGAFEFKDVAFFYPETDEAGVRNLNLKVEPGESIAFVGKSGCGKSTTLSLILGFIRPVSGHILLDGKNMETLDLRQYRQHVGVVTQDTVFFSSSIRDNVAYGMPEIHEEHVWWALERAQALDFINELPEGIETRIGSDGVNLSGGQRQRLSIARALIRNPKVLLFDEATSALDVQTEAVLQDVLEELMRNRTTFIVSHRFSTIRNADRIVVMDGGEIVQEGSHHLLMEQDNYYSRSVRLQLVG